MERYTERERVRAELLDRAAEGEPRWLLAQLLEYHRREARPQWWEYFHHRSLDEEELREDSDTIGGLELVGEPIEDKQSLVYAFSFPAQEHKIGTSGVDPVTERSYSVVVDNERGTVTLKRGKKLSDEPLPRALIPPKPLRTREQRNAVLRFAKNQARYPALAEILERKPPRARLVPKLEEAELSLEGSYLFVQGPPGSGKTWNGARMAIALMKAGQRVGITALSHKAIHKFLEDLEEAAHEVGYRFRGMKKCGKDPGTRFESRHDLVENTGENAGMLDPSSSSLPARRSFSRARSLTSTSTRCSSTRVGSSRSATPSPSGRPRATSCCSATRTSYLRFRRALIRRARTLRCSRICSASTRRSSLTWGSSSSTPGGCGPR